jgi:hypothetical protein
MVYRRDLHERAEPIAGTLLGNCLGQIARRHEDADGHGVTFRQNQRCLSGQEAG